jgi:hypothetical protein
MLFTADRGNLAGNAFLVVDVNRTACYRAAKISSSTSQPD